MKPLTIVAGEGATDTALTQFPQALVIEVRDTSGAPRRGLTVRFLALPPTDTARRNESAVTVATLLSGTFNSLSADLTDSDGRAKALVRLGTVAGVAMIQIDAPELGLCDTARYLVLPGNATQLTMRVRDTSVYSGAQYAIGAAARDRWGNVRPNDVLTYTARTPNVSVDGSGNVSATSEGRAAVVVSAATKVDTARASVMPRGTLLFMRQYPIPRAVAMMNLDGTGLRTILPVTDWSVGPQWAPDGNGLVVYLGDPESNASVAKVTLDGKQTTLVAVGSASKLNGLAWPRYAPDGTIYFSGFASSAGVQIWHMNADGTGLTMLPNTTGNDWQHPAISSDGKTLYFEASLPQKIYKLDLTTGIAVSLGISGTFPAPSPDGTKLAYVGPSGLVTLADISGSNAIAVSNTTVMDYTPPSWSADGRWLLLPTKSPSLRRVSDGMTMPLPNVSGGYFQVVLR